MLYCESSGDDTPNTGDAEGVPLPLSILADGPLAMCEGTCWKSPQENEHHDSVHVSVWYDAYTHVFIYGTELRFESSSTRAKHIVTLMLHDAIWDMCSPLLHGTRCQLPSNMVHSQTVPNLVSHSWMGKFPSGVQAESTWTYCNFDHLLHCC